MMTQEQAAKYFIVGWIKGWSLPFYYMTVMEVPIGTKGNADARFDEAHNAFKWLPCDPFMYLTKTTCQRYIGDHMPALNESLFNCDDNQSRLKLWRQVEKHDGANCKKKISRQFQRERAEMKRMDKQDKRDYQTNQMSIGEMRRGSGHAWNVCK